MNCYMFNFDLSPFRLNTGFHWCDPVRCRATRKGGDKHNAGTPSVTADPLGMLRQVVGVDTTVLGSETPLAPEGVRSAPGLVR